MPLDERAKYTILPYTSYMTLNKKSNIEIATFGAGCFWKPQEMFDQLPGVIKTTVGYMGGGVENPTYEMVCTDTTGHAEVTQVQYDPSIISYENLLKTFWTIHDPTQINRQGPDVGKQYRSVVFYHTDQQQKLAEKIRQAMINSGNFTAEVVTEILPSTTFYEAEDYHQQYYKKQGIR